MFKGSLKHTIEEKYLDHKPKEQKNKISHVHKNLDEELRPLSMINKSVKQLNGVKGVFIKEIYMMSNMFSWNTSNVFEIHEGDSQGKQLDPNSKPILYAVAKLSECCSCNTETMGTSDIAITTRLDDRQSDAPYIFIKEINVCFGPNKANIFINENGNGTLIGNIQEKICSRSKMVINSDYVNNLEIIHPYCQCQFQQTTYQLEDADKNKGSILFKVNCCDCGNPYTYECGFPPNYDENKNTILLSSVIYLGYLNFQKRKKKRK